MRKGIKRILSVSLVMIVVAAFLATMALASTTSMNKVIPEDGTKYVVGTGSISKIGDFGILDDNGFDFYTADLDEDMQKVGLKVQYAGYATGNTIELVYLKSVYFNYDNDVSCLPGMEKSSSNGWDD